MTHPIVNILFIAIIGYLLIGWGMWLQNHKNGYPYTYYVVYNFTSNDGRTGFGAMELARKTKLDSASEIENARQFIKDEQKFKEVLIMSFTKVNK